VVGVVNNQIKKGLLLSLSVNFFKSNIIWQRYTREGGCLMHFVRLATTLLTDEESARDNHLLACKVKGKVFPYSLPSVRPGADPGVQAVSPQVTGDVK